MHIYHAIRCFGIQISPKACERFRQIVEDRISKLLISWSNSPVRYFLSSSKLLPWFHPVLNPLIYYFFGSICGPLRHTLNVDGKNALVISNISYPVISVLTKWGRSTIRRGSDESDVSTIVDGEFQT